MFSFLLGGKPHDFDVWPNKTQNVALRDNKKATVVSGFYPKNQKLSDSAYSIFGSSL